MNRRGFLKAIGGTGVAAVAAPLIAMAGPDIGPLIGPYVDPAAWFPIPDAPSAFSTSEGMVGYVMTDAKFYGFPLADEEILQSYQLAATP